MPRRLMIVEYDDDEELSKSRKSPGKHSPLTRDRDGNLSHVVLDEVSDDDLAAYADTRPSPDDDWDGDDDSYDARLNERDVEALAALLTALVEVVGPRLRDWWRNSGRDSARAARDRMVARIARRRRGHTADVELIDTAPSPTRPNTKAQTSPSTRPAAYSTTPWRPPPTPSTRSIYSNGPPSWTTALRPRSPTHSDGWVPALSQTPSRCSARPTQ